MGLYKLNNNLQLQEGFLQNHQNNINITPEYRKKKS